MRTPTRLATCIATLVPVLCFSVAHAQTGPGATGTASTDSSSDAGTRSSDASGQKSGAGHDTPTSKEFVKRAAQSNLAEIKVSELAQSKAQSPDVKKFAQQMIEDHTQANAELAQIAKTKNLEVPDDADMMHKASMKLLQGKSGSSFDTAYMQQMDKDHQKAIDLFQSASSSPKVDKDLQAFASKTLPKLEQHHHLVAQIESKQGSSSASAGSSSSKR